jgi:lipoprotein-anchoring transpeptidase ErfK/SrfK
MLLLGLLALALSAPPGAGAAAPAPFTIAAPTRADGATIARIVRPTFARARLDRVARGVRVSSQTSWSRQAQALLVLAGARHDGREWVKVRLADRPNGSTGWIPRDHVVLRRTPYWVHVRTRARTVTIYRNGRRVRHFGAVVGAPGTPTPVGLAALYERNRQPDPRAFLGPWALSLTSLSEVLEDYGGGPGRVAIHGRAGASLLDPLGTARSHGCIRIDNVHVSWMASHLPVGTPVQVTRSG